MNYATKIPEELDFLLQAEKQRGSALDRDRIRFLRLLKSGQCATQAQAGVAIGLGERQAQRLWKTYQQAGLQGLMSQPARRGWGKLSSFQITQLRQFLLADQAQTQADIQAYLKANFQVSYTIGGISHLCKRLKIKHKTGRPVNVRQQPGAIEFFKKVW